MEAETLGDPSTTRTRNPGPACGGAQPHAPARAALQIAARFDDTPGMSSTPEGRTSYDDPRRLRELLSRARDLASEHALSSVLVGIGGFEGDRLFPEVVNYVESALRVDDSVFRMTRERAVLLLTDVDLDGAKRILERILETFGEHFPTAGEPSVACGYFEITAGDPEPTAKEVLPKLFASSPPTH